MGAYYMAAIENKTFNPHDTDNGMKLMEHSYLYNSYCCAIESMLLDKPQPLVWLCDYHEADETTELTWGICARTEYKPASPEYSDFKWPVYIINHTKKEFYNKQELAKLIEDEWKINPLPILTNSDKYAMGGGDYSPDDERRTTWCGDIIEVTLSKDKTKDYEDVTADVIFYE